VKKQTGRQEGLHKVYADFKLNKQMITAVWFNRKKPSLSKV